MTVGQVALTSSPLASVTLRGAAEDESLRPFQFHASDEPLADLRQHVAATQWPDKETVADATPRHKLGRDRR